MADLRTLEELLLARVNEWPDPIDEKNCADLIASARDDFVVSDELRVELGNFWFYFASFMQGFEIVTDEKTGDAVYIKTIDYVRGEEQYGIFTIKSGNLTYATRVHCHRLLLSNNNHPFWGNIEVIEQRYGDDDFIGFDDELASAHLRNFLQKDGPDPTPTDWPRLFRELKDIEWNRAQKEYNWVMESAQEKYGLTAAKLIKTAIKPCDKIINTQAPRHTGKLLDELPFLKTQEAFNEFCYAHRSYTRRMANGMLALSHRNVPRDVIARMSEYTVGDISNDEENQRRRRKAVATLQRLHTRPQKRRSAPRGSSPPPQKPRSGPDDHKDSELF